MLNVALFGPRGGQGDAGTAPWVVRLWDTIDSEEREGVLAILAEMARDDLVAPGRISREGKNHES